jgi:outer membrane protein assembly factor BamC
LGTLYSTGTRDKYRIRLERDTAPGTTDVYISQFGMQEVVVNQEGAAEIGETRWEPRPTDPGLEAEMLRLLIVSLGVKEEKAKGMIEPLAATPPAERATLTRRVRPHRSACRRISNAPGGVSGRSIDQSPRKTA